MFIYTILSSKLHNNHHLTRYIKFISSCVVSNMTVVGLTHKHHICPKALFPEYSSFKDNPWNSAKLTLRQHFIAHWMLWKIYDDSKTAQAIFFMNRNSKINLSSRAYESVKTAFTIAMSGENNPNKIVSIETRIKQRAAKLGKPITETAKAKMRGPRYSYGSGRIDERSECPHCATIGGCRAMKRYHFDNCKFKLTKLA